MEPENKPQSIDAGRKYTKAELKRLESFNATVEELKQQGFVRKDLTVSILKANLIGPILVLPFEIMFFALFFLINGIAPVKDMFLFQSVGNLIVVVLVAASFIPLIPIHELIHGISWAPGARNKMKDIEFGFIKEMLTPYCYCRSPLSKGRYIFGSLMPMTLLGAIPFILAIVSGNACLLLIAPIQLIGGAGDIMISFMLLRYRSNGKKFVIMDHPTDCGLVIFEKE